MSIFIALTFDDGTYHQYTLLRLLHRLNIKGTIFCVTNLERHHNTNKKLLIRRPEKLREIHRMGHEIGSHTCTHPDLTLLSTTELERELKNSKDKLEKIIGDNVQSFAYPYSLFNKRTLMKVKEYYFCARCGPSSKISFNINIRDKYKISSIGIKKLIVLTPKIIQFRWSIRDIFVVIMMHDTPKIILLSLILYLKILFNPIFIRIKELADMMKI
ncbi:MAG: polysaccharide deacetylase family protein [Candidatus Odinarchaeia archaeon]